MSLKTLLEKVQYCREENEPAVLEVYEKFNPLLKKYTYKLGTDDAYNELTVFFVELLYKIPINNFAGETADYRLLAYIKKAVYFQYVKLSKEENKHQLYSLELNEDLSPCCENDMDATMFLNARIHKLTPLQQDVIKAKYYWGLSEPEIAQYLKITRQAVNRIKNRALKQIRVEL